MDPYSAESRAEAERLIQEEMRRFLPSNYLKHHPAGNLRFSVRPRPGRPACPPAHSPPLSQSPLLQAELERVSQGKPLKALDRERCAAAALCLAWVRP